MREHSDVEDTDPEVFQLQLEVERTLWGNSPVPVAVCPLLQPYIPG